MITPCPVPVRTEKLYDQSIAIAQRMPILPCRRIKTSRARWMAPPGIGTADRRYCRLRHEIKEKISIDKGPAASGKSATRKLSATVRLELRVSSAATALEDFAKSPIYVPTITKITAKIYYIDRYDYFYLHYPAIIPQPTNEKTHVFGLKVNIHPTKVNIHGNPNPQFS